MSRAAYLAARRLDRDEGSRFVSVHLSVSLARRFHALADRIEGPRSQLFAAAIELWCAAHERREAAER